MRIEIHEIIQRLEALADPKAVEGMARFGITAKSVFGVSIPNLRKMAKDLGKDHRCIMNLLKKTPYAYQKALITEMVMLAIFKEASRKWR